MFNRIAIVVAQLAVARLVCRPDDRTPFHRRLFVCLFIFVRAGLRKNYSTDFQKIGQKDGKWVQEETFLVVLPIMLR